jgi:hypothetical protein
MTTYVGDSDTASVTFSKDGVATAATVACEVRSPSGTVTEPTPTNPSTGVYKTEVDFDEAGTWFVKFTATGGVKAVSILRRTVESSEL